MNENTKKKQAVEILDSVIYLEMKKLNNHIKQKRISINKAVDIIIKFAEVKCTAHHQNKKLYGRNGTVSKELMQVYTELCEIALN